MDQLGQNRAKQGALRKPTTIGEACRALLRRTLRSTIAWAICHLPLVTVPTFHFRPHFR
jgi:hypothetical protein